jgi:hypothetical protein
LLLSLEFRDMDRLGLAVHNVRLCATGGQFASASPRAICGPRVETPDFGNTNHADGYWVAIADDPLVFMSDRAFLTERKLGRASMPRHT